jgi:2-polyprenyl-3-methyl-5-hydroxy-6-metoxy-1,4-benzoquinol methylase
MVDLTPRQLSQALKAVSPDANMLDRLKIGYRPYICPFHHLLAHIANRASVYDIGCGSGMFLYLCAFFKAPKELGGFDIEEKLIQHANQILRKTGVSTNLQVVDPGEIPAIIHEFEVVSMIDVLHHIPHTKHFAFFRKLYNSMSNGATLLLKDIDGASPWVVFNKLHDWAITGEIGNELPWKELEALLKKVGFYIELIEQEQVWWYPHVTIIAKKHI